MPCLDRRSDLVIIQTERRADREAAAAASSSSLLAIPSSASSDLIDQEALDQISPSTPPQMKTISKKRKRLTGSVQSANSSSHMASSSNTMLRSEAKARSSVLKFR